MIGDRFEYIIASIKRDTKRRQSGLETSTMQVILKRQPRAGMDMQVPFMGIGSIRPPINGLVDLEYHYNWTWEANSLSTVWNTRTSAEGIAERS